MRALVITGVVFLVVLVAATFVVLYNHNTRLTGMVSVYEKTLSSCQDKCFSHSYAAKMLQLNDELVKTNRACIVMLESVKDTPLQLILSEPVTSRVKHKKSYYEMVRTIGVGGVLPVTGTSNVYIEVPE